MYVSCQFLFILFGLIRSGSLVPMTPWFLSPFSLYPTPIDHLPQSPLTSHPSFHSFKFRRNAADRLLYIICSGRGLVDPEIELFHFTTKGQTM